MKKIYAIHVLLAFSASLSAIEPSEKVQPLAPSSPPIVPEAKNSSDSTSAAADHTRSITPEEVQRLNEESQKPKLPTAKAGHVTNAAFLGISVSPIPPLLAQHLQIKDGSGVKVEMLVPESAAALAGIQVNDIIFSIDSLPLKNSDSLTQIITKHKPGDVVQISLFQQGAATHKNITLGARPAALSQALPPQRLPYNDEMDIFKTMPTQQAEMMRQHMERLNALQQNNDQILDDIQARCENLLNDRIHRALKEKAELEPQQNGNVQSSSTIRMLLGDKTLEITKNNGDAKVTMLDRHGKVAWSGPWNTEEDLAAAPAEIRSQIENLNLKNSNENGFQFQFRSK